MKLFSSLILSSSLFISTITHAADIYNYQQNNEPWQEKWQKLKEGDHSIIFRIIQIGDSHTAGDFFSEEARTYLQNQLGNAGIGWVAPTPVAGQRNSAVRYQGEFGITRSSRKDSGIFPLGGIAMSGSGNHVQIQAPSNPQQRHNIRFTVRTLLGSDSLTITDKTGQYHLAVSPQSTWQIIETQAYLPFSYTLPSNNITEIGQISLENGQKGITYSAMGINGSQFTHWDKWTDWEENLSQTQADLIVLAYGTNEAFNSTLDIEQTEKKWRQNIQKIKTALPQAGIVLIGAPESLKSQSGSCGIRPNKLDQVQAMQHNIARSENILFWSWQESMGGTCSMKHHIAQGLASKDGVHFSAKGYRQAGTDFAQALMKIHLHAN